MNFASTLAEFRAATYNGFLENVLMGASTHFPVHDYAGFRRQMVERQLRARGIRDECVLNAMLTIAREEFVPAEMRELAYMDRPIAIGEEQTISQPYMVASMAEALRLTGKEKVLEVGTGSGYAAAVLSRLANHVHTVESRPALAAAAQSRLARLGFENVSVHSGDGSLGFAEAAPYDAIVVAAAAPAIPQPLVDQLSPNGRMIVPVGAGETQDLMLVERRGGAIHSRSLYQCRFVPLTGQHGFSS
jgi:protein-L-isoaspartate(D-aspartate) O-methyltransferase